MSLSVESLSARILSEKRRCREQLVAMRSVSVSDVCYEDEESAESLSTRSRSW